MILHPGEAVDDPRHSWQRPEVRAEAMRARALAQRRFDLTQLLGRQPRLAAGSPGGPQRRAPALAPRVIPAHDALAADLEQPCDRALRLLALGEEASRLLSPKLQRSEVPSRGTLGSHAPRIREPEVAVTLLCEIQ
jgi:hypothetical protein